MNINNPNSEIALNTFETIKKVLECRVSALKDLYDDVDPMELLEDLDFEEIEPLISCEYLGHGSHKICFTNGYEVYVLFHCEHDETKSILTQNLKHEIWPKVTHVHGKLYKMPYYNVIKYSKMNSVQRSILASLSEYEHGGKLNYGDYNLPDYIIDGLNEAAEIERLCNDVRDENIGWIGNKPVLFDAFWMEI